MPRTSLPSFLLGFLTACLLLVVGQQENRAEALDFSNIGDIGKNLTAAVKSLGGLKKNLDSDVSALTSHAKILIGDKENLKLIKEQLLKLATETRSQIDSVAQLVSTVDDHLKQTKTSIDTTSTHVGEIDAIKKSISPK
jgi:uncharacterized phage infection (PIP) family protein YhgE